MVKAQERESFHGFDWKAYGDYVRKVRQSKGYPNTKEFSDTIYRRTRIRISPDQLFRIENGRQEPKAEQFMAINLTLFNNIWDSNHSKDKMDYFLSDEWNQLDGGGTVPEKWQSENLENDVKPLETDNGRKFVSFFKLPDPDHKVYPLGVSVFLAINDNGYIKDTACNGKYNLKIMTEVDGISLGYMPAEDNK